MRWLSYFTGYLALFLPQSIFSQDAGQKLFLLEMGKNQTCVWSFCELPSCSKTHNFLSSPGCPTELLWDAKRKRSIFLTEKGMFLHTWKSAQLIEIKDAPASIKKIGVGKAGELIVTVMDPIPDSDLIRNAKGEIVRDTDDNFSFRYQGKIYKSTGFGVPYMASRWSSMDGKKWKKLDHRESSWEAGDSLGPSVYSEEERNPDRAVDALNVGNDTNENWVLYHLRSKGKDYVRPKRALAFGVH